ncbi:MAG TPA: AAA family ATPase, partial [Candidatus Polarisedimenticolaceae bacterium]|nr:AAA family ATPase [Candidatus Polarisedimenticolaceae bacterium]
MALERIQDQPRAVELLRRALGSERVAHAYAFIGPPGAGRMTIALAFAEELLASAARPHPDLHVIVPTPPESNPRGSRAIRINAIRELERRASLRPAMARRKVFIIDEAERMTDDTPQAFLKTLEEPPAATVIILILPRARAVPATLLSRCQVVRFAPRADAGATAARAQAVEILTEVRAQGVDALFRRTDRLEREKAEALVDAYWLFCRDLLVAKTGAPSGLLIDGARAEELAREAEGWTIDEIVAAVDVCRQARDALLRNV